MVSDTTWPVVIINLSFALAFKLDKANQIKEFNKITVITNFFITA